MSQHVRTVGGGWGVPERHGGRADKRQCVRVRELPTQHHSLHPAGLPTCLCSVVTLPGTEQPVAPSLSGPSSVKRREVEQRWVEFSPGQLLLPGPEQRPNCDGGPGRVMAWFLQELGTRGAGVCGAQPACDTPRMSRETAREWLSTESG